VKLIKKWGRPAVMACMLATLSACGGGGGSGKDDRADPKNAADGLGDYGEVPGTVKLGRVTQSSGSAGGGIYNGVTSALDDAGRALVAWRVDTGSFTTSQAAWAESSSTGAWSTTQSLPQASNISLYGMALRMNANGDAVLGWVDAGNNTTLSYGRRAIRYTAGAGWSTTILDLSGGTQYSTTGHPIDWDLQLLSDGRLITKVAASGGPASVLEIDTGGNPSTALTATTEANRTAFAFRPDGNGYRYMLEDSSSTPGAVELVFQRASVQLGPLGPLPIATYAGLCSYPSWYSAPSITAATASSERSVVAVLSRETSTSSCDTHNLQLLAVSDPSSIRADTQRANAFGSWLPVPPTLAMDQAGNTLAVWKEATGTQYGVQTGNTYRLMWAQALAGQAWSTPQTLIPNLASLGTIPNDGRIVVSMNRSGQAVAALVLNDLTGSSINASIVLSRFDFTTGWSDWKRVANKLMVSDPSVSINASGAALLAYTAIDGRRIDGKAPSVVSTSFAYAWRF
jgi:hypothetical protein